MKKLLLKLRKILAMNYKFSLLNFPIPISRKIHKKPLDFLKQKYENLLKLEEEIGMEEKRETHGIHEVFIYYNWNSQTSDPN